MAFNDGDPIDAALLAELDTRLNDLAAKVVQIGAPGSTAIPQIYASMHRGVTLVPGKDVVFTIDYSAAKLSSTPSSVILTPVHPSKATHSDFYVITAGSSSASCGAFISASAKEFTTDFYYLVITN
jgi:hypothetical protein